MRMIRLSLAVLMAAVALGAAVTSASANRLSLSSNSFRVVFSEPGAEIPPGQIACAATLEGTFHSRTITKVVGALIGHLTRAQFREERCANGTGRFLRETLPWHVRYEAFTGTLPAIASLRIQLIGVAIAWTLTGFSECLVRTTVERPGRAILARNTTTGVLTTFRWDETARITGTGFCDEAEQSIFGTNGVTVLGSTTAITLTLI